MSKKLFIVVNVDFFFLSHRKEIALAAQQNGFDVTIVTHNTGKKNEIEKLGLNYVELPNIRSLKNVFKELRVLLFLFLMYKKDKPDIVHHVGLKLVLYGTVVARLANVRSIVNAISGLGILFS